MVRSSWWSSRTALQTLLSLIFGVIFIQLAVLALFFSAYNRLWHPVTSQHIQKQVVRSIRLASVITPSQLSAHLNMLRGRGFHFTLVDAPDPKAEVIPMVDTGLIERAIARQYPRFSFSVLLPQNQWLVVRGRYAVHPMKWVGFVLINAVLLITLIALCWWSVRRLAMPWRGFVEAVQRFGVDVRSPGMVDGGSREMREVAKAFNEMQARIQRLLDDRSQMLAAISHDLRTPVTRLRLRLEQWQDSAQTLKAQADLNEIEHMVTSILAFARDYTRNEAMEQLDLAALLETLCNDFSDMGKPVQFATSIKRLPVLGREAALRRMFANLIDNAVKYGQSAQVELSQQDGTNIIKITDQGPGIEQSLHEKIFQPFFRVDTARSSEVSGTGLGLTVARDIVHAHGGEIRLFNLPQGGLQVVIIL